MVVLPEADAPRQEAVVYLAGHPHPMLIKAGRALPVGDPGPLLGVVDEPSWRGVTVEIEPGDQLVLYTDGVIEARGDGGERFGAERLQRGLDGCQSPDAGGRAGSRRALAIRRPRPRRRRRAGRDPPHRRRSEGDRDGGRPSAA